MRVPVPGHVHRLVEAVQRQGRRARRGERGGGAQERRGKSRVQGQRGCQERRRGRRALAWAVNAAAKRVGGGPPVDEDALAGRAGRAEEEAAARRGIDMSRLRLGLPMAPLAVERRRDEDVHATASTPGTTPPTPRSSGEADPGEGRGRVRARRTLPSTWVDEVGLAAEAPPYGDGWGDMDVRHLDAGREHLCSDGVSSATRPPPSAAVVTTGSRGRRRGTVGGRGRRRRRRVVQRRGGC